MNPPVRDLKLVDVILSKLIGEVTRVGEGVTEWKAGDRVAIEAGIPCGHCHFCKVGDNFLISSYLTF